MGEPRALGSNTPNDTGSVELVWEMTGRSLSSGPRDMFQDSHVVGIWA